MAPKALPKVISQDANTMLQSLQDENHSQKAMIDQLHEVIKDRDREIEEIRILLSQTNDSLASEKNDGAEGTFN